jgi:hypothetical protein
MQLGTLGRHKCSTYQNDSNVICRLVLAGCKSRAFGFVIDFTCDQVIQVIPTSGFLNTGQWI